MEGNGWICVYVGLGVCVGGTVGFCVYVDLGVCAGGTVGFCVDVNLGIYVGNGPRPFREKMIISVWSRDGERVKGTVGLCLYMYFSECAGGTVGFVHI